MISVSLNKIANIALSKILKVSRIKDIGFVVVFIKNLLKHQKSHFIAQVQHFGSGRIVAGPDGIATHGFHYFQLPFHCSEVESCS